MKLLCARLVIAAFLVLGAVAAASRPLNLVIIGNFGPSDSRTNTLPTPPLPSDSDVPQQRDWEAGFAEAVRSFASRASVSYSGAQLSLPVVINTGGRITKAINRLSAALNATAPDAVIISDSYEVSVAVQAAIVETFGASVMVVMAQTAAADIDFASTAVGPSSVRVMPSDTVQATRLVDMLEALNWQALSQITTADDYGDGFDLALAAACNIKQVPPRVLSKLSLTGWASPDRDADDVSIIRRAAETGARGVIVAGGPGTAARVLNAAARARTQLSGTVPAIQDLFFIFTSAAMIDFPMLPANAPANHAVITPSFTSLTDLEDGRWLSLHSPYTDGFAFQLSYLLDSMNLVAAASAALSANQTLSASSLLAAVTSKSTTITPIFTGAMSVSTSTRNRNTDGQWVLTKLSHASRAVGTTIATVTAAGVATVTSPGVVPASTQRVVDVCVVGSDSCADYANVAYAVFALLEARTGRQTPTLPQGISVKPVPLAAGTTGVRAINAVSSHARSCDFLVGPSRTALTIAINPLVAFYQIPTIDFGSTASVLSDKVNFPFFSRTAPTDIAFAQATGAAMRHFGWDRIAVITTQDSYGAGVVEHYTKAMNENNGEVEQTFLIDAHDTTNTSVVAALREIKDNLITRIVLIALPSSDAQLDDLFSAVESFGMQSSHIFILGDTVCQYTALRPTTRSPLVGSICVLPDFSTNPVVPPDTAEALSLLRAGGFQTDQCSFAFTDMYSPFAHDAANVVVDTISRMVEANGGSISDPNRPSRSIFTNGTATVNALRKTVLRNGFSGSVRFKPNGDRRDEGFTLQIQQSDGLVNFGSWTESMGFRADTDVEIRWADNTTDIPKASTRSVSFIAARTAKQNPGVIVVSVLGFIVTITMFVFCFKYQQMKKRVAGVDDGQHGGEEGREDPAQEMSK